MSPTDSDLVRSTTLDSVLLLVVCLAGLGAAGLQWFGYRSLDLLALMVVALAGLLWSLNLRLVAVLKRQRRRKAQPESE